MMIVRWLKTQCVRVWFSAQMAGHGITANPLRSALTILGVAVGVASVISLMGIGEGARLAVVRQFESLGSNVVVVTAHARPYEFQSTDAEELVDRVAGLNMATPVVHTNATMLWRRARARVELLGVNQEFPQIRDHFMVSGHFFTSLNVKQRAPVAVLGYNVGRALLGGRSPVGGTLSLNGLSYRIIGVLSPKGAGGGDGIDDVIVIPYTTAQRIAGKSTFAEIWGKAGSPVEADLAVVQLGRIMRRKIGLDKKAPTAAPPPATGEPSEPDRPMPIDPERPPEPSPPEADQGGDLITITSLNQLVQEADQANRVMTLLLGGIAAVSLLVGGLGIMNIMLVAVTERTAEIGVRRAIGAKQTDLLIQFLLEAVYLSATGAVAGTAAGVWGLSLFARYGFETALSLQAVRVASGVALGAGLLFGVYPAISASSVPPVEALRR